MSRASALLALAAALPLPAAALDSQVHGFAAQGWTLSDGNNLLGDSTDDGGSFEYYEAGVNVTLDLHPQLLASAQALVRDAGATDDEGLRIDYALLDWRFLRSAERRAGLRIGRVRNFFGLYNATQDVVFARPGILMPQSVYFGGQGFRSVLFATEGIQLYGEAAVAGHDLALVASRAPDFEADAEERRQFAGGAPALPNDIRFSNLTIARVQDEWADGNLRAALSYLDMDIAIAPHPDSALSGALHFRMYVASLRWAGARFAVTTEYALHSSDGEFGGFGRFDTTGDGAWLQGDWFIDPRWTASARLDASFANRDDRDGRDYARASGADRHDQFAVDTMLGLRWQPDLRWGVWAEQHWIDGTATVSGLDNFGRARAPHWSATLLMAGYRF